MRPKIYQIRIAFVFILLFLTTGCEQAWAYTITGRFKNLTCYYPKVYLAAIKRIDGIYHANYQDIIATASISSDGDFMISGNDLPEENYYYRLYVTSEEGINTSIHAGRRRNYILLALNNRSEVTVTTEDFCTDYFSYTISGSRESEGIKAVQNQLQEYMQVRWDSIGATKRGLLEKKRFSDLKQFADTSTSLLAGLWAVTEMDIDSTYTAESAFFSTFADKFRKKANAPLYADQLDKKLEDLKYRSEMKQYHPSFLLFAAVLALLVCSVSVNIWQWRNRGRAGKEEPKVIISETTVATISEEENSKKAIEALTIKEREILKMIHEGFSNKEIADKQNVEVSTVKTHVSRIYQKTDIKNRKEVAAIARYL